MYFILFVLFYYYYYIYIFGGFVVVGAVLHLLGSTALMCFTHPPPRYLYRCLTRLRALRRLTSDHPSRAKVLSQIYILMLLPEVFYFAEN